MRDAKMWVSARLSGVRSATLLPAVALSSPSPGKVPKYYAMGQKGTDSSLYAVLLLQSYYIFLRWQEKTQRERGARDFRGVVLVS
jgi:hypothetical protein